MYIRLAVDGYIQSYNKRSRCVESRSRGVVGDGRLTSAGGVSASSLYEISVFFSYMYVYTETCSFK